MRECFTMLALPVFLLAFITHAIWTVILIGWTCGWATGDKLQTEIWRER